MKLHQVVLRLAQILVCNANRRIHVFKHRGGLRELVPRSFALFTQRLLDVRGGAAYDRQDLIEVRTCGFQLDEAEMQVPAGESENREGRD
jgi:hypothetical protein